MEYDAIVIGAGVGGLSSALKLSASGKKVLVIERQPVPGGCATSFTRRGFTFESAMHCVSGLGPEGEIRGFFEEFGIDKTIDFIELKDFCRIIYPEHDFVIDFDKENFLNFLKNKFPEECQNIDKLFLRLDKFHKQFDSFCASKLPLVLQLILSPFIYPEVIKLSSLTVTELFDKCLKDEKLKSIIADLWRFIGLPPSELSALYFLIILKAYWFEKNYYVKGGYSQLFNKISEKIKQNGSEIKYNTTVKTIIIEKKCARGVITDRGEKFFAKTVISNANAIETLAELIDDAVIREKYDKELAKLEKSVSVFQVYLGLTVPAKTLGMSNFMVSLNSSYDHEKSFSDSISAEGNNCFIEIVDHAQLDPSLAPEGKGTLLIMTFDSYKNWQGLTDEEYKQKKKMIADRLIKWAEKLLPGLSNHIELMEVATPKTMYRYTLSPEGAIYGFAHSVKQSGMFRLGQETCIKGLFLAGAWTRPGAGIQACFLSGIDAAELALKFLD
ncbi:MAG: NAD(P)/FAD-dependent oxidoreductase [Candidatus Omnitrophica bacterium]|jgi:prolycopene isomerase|nr:NAD(P)/FAD-dependent oxidoreductase [Candidatus Omnitrophota bacterium]